MMDSTYFKNAKHKKRKFLRKAWAGFLALGPWGPGVLGKQPDSLWQISFNRVRLSRRGALFRATSKKLWREGDGKQRIRPEADQGASGLQEPLGSALEWSRDWWVFSSLIFSLETSEWANSDPDGQAFLFFPLTLQNCFVLRGDPPSRKLQMIHQDICGTTGNSCTNDITSGTESWKEHELGSEETLSPCCRSACEMVETWFHLAGPP